MLWNVFLLTIFWHSLFAGWGSVKVLNRFSCLANSKYQNMSNGKINVHLIKTLGIFSFFLEEKLSAKYHWFIGLRQAEYLTFLNKIPESPLPLLRHFTLIHVLFSSIEPWKVVSFEIICEVHAWRKPRDVNLLNHSVQKTIWLNARKFFSSVIHFCFVFH